MKNINNNLPKGIPSGMEFTYQGKEYNVFGTGVILDENGIALDCKSVKYANIVEAIYDENRVVTKLINEDDINKWHMYH